MINLTTLHVVRGSVPSKILAASHDDAIDLAVKGELAGEFRAERLTDWLGGSLDGDELRREIERRLN
jgi:hypothetical protein